MQTAAQTAPTAPTAPERFKCTALCCDKTFATRYDLNRHQQTHLSTKAHRCPHPGCSKWFRRKDHLNAHMLTHSDERPFKCTFPGCGTAFRTTAALRQHTRDTHRSVTHRCDICDVSFRSKRALSRHLFTRVHRRLAPSYAPEPRSNREPSPDPSLAVYPVFTHNASPPERCDLAHFMGQLSPPGPEREILRMIQSKPSGRGGDGHSRAALSNFMGRL
jgi:uncharacterized Zn-finger protein